jgi:hypothetical protein
VPPEYPAAEPGDRYAGEHAYAQSARYGAQYGVPGYPPPPPYGAPGYDPAAHPAAAPGDTTAVVGPRAEPPAPAGPAAPAAPAAEARPVVGTGAHRARSEAVEDATAGPASGPQAAPGPASRAGSTRTGSHAAADSDDGDDGDDVRTRAIPRFTV